MNTPPVMEPIVCPWCKGKKTNIAVDAILADGTRVNPRVEPCMVCEGKGTYIPDPPDPILPPGPPSMDIRSVEERFVEVTPSEWLTSHAPRDVKWLINRVRELEDEKYELRSKLSMTGYYRDSWDW